MLTSQDLDVGIDFTGLVAGATAADHNLLVNLAIPHSDSVYNGKGLVLFTKDGAPGIPEVPNCNGYTKWKKYLWVRLRNDPAITDKTPLIYAWNDDAANNATLLKWKLLTPDVTALQTQLNSLQNEIDGVSDTASNALSVASSLNQIATDAQSAASDALTEANSASSAVASANAASANAVTAVDNLTTTVNAVKATADAALSASQASRPIADAIQVPADKHGFFVAVSQIADSLEYLRLSDYFAICTERVADGAEATLAADGYNEKYFSTLEFAGNNCIQLVGVGPSKKINFLVAGKYLIDIEIPGWLAGNFNRKTRIANDSTNAILLYGTQCSVNCGVNLIHTVSRIVGIIDATVGLTLKIQDWYAPHGGTCYKRYSPALSNTDDRIYMTGKIIKLV